MCRYLGVHVDGRVTGVSSCHLVGEGEHLLGERDASGGDGLFCPLFFVYHIVGGRDRRTRPVGRSVGVIQRMLPRPLSSPSGFGQRSAGRTGEGAEMLAARKEGGSPGGRVRAWQKCGTSAAALVSCKCYGAGGWSSAFRGGRKGNILGMFKWWFSLLFLYPGLLGRDGNVKYRGFGSRWSCRPDNS